MFRKNRPILIILLLAFTLHSSQAQAAFSWRSITDSVYSWFQEKSPASVFFASALVGVAVYLSYSWLAEKKAIPKPEKNTTKQPSSQENTEQPLK